MILTVKGMESVAPKGAPFVPTLIRIFEKYKFADEREQAMALAQWAHETQGFARLEENLYYTTPIRVAEIFRSAFDKNKDKKITSDEIAVAANYCCNPKALANKVYANRYGNGDEASGDGYAFRGGGLTHLTFKDNYRAASKAIYGDDQLVKNPDTVRTVLGACETAAYFWSATGARPAALRGDFSGVTRAINSAMAGHADRVAWLVKFNKVLGVKP